MAGANGVEKRLTCDREERIHLKELSPAYYSRFVNPGPIPSNNLVDPVKDVLNPTLLRYPFLAPVIPASGVLDVQQVTNDMYLDATVAAGMTTPSAATIAAFVGKRFLTSLGIGEFGATAATPLQNELDGFETTIENFDAAGTKTITFGAGITPASIAFLPKTISVVRWEFTRNNPPTLRVYVLSVTSSTNGLPIPSPPTPVVFPIGILANDGTTIFGRTLIAGQADLAIANANGTTGNPTISFNLTTAGLLVGPDLQPTVNYLGSIQNVTNGFRWSNHTGFVVPAASGIVPITFTLNAARGDWGTDPNWNGTIYTVPGGTPASALYEVYVEWTFNGDIGATDGELEVNFRNINTAVDYAGHSSVIVAPGNGGGYSQIVSLIPDQYEFYMDNTDTVANCTIRGFDVGVRRIQ